MMLVSRRFVPALLLCAAICVPPAARADSRDDGKAMVQRMASQVVSILSNKSIDRAGKEARFRQILTQNFDVPTIGAWVMGGPWRSATPAQRAEYLKLFETYIVKVYTGQLSTYSGESITVIGAEDDGGGVAVLSRVTDPKNDRTIEIKWRLRPTDGKMKVRDVLIENISMSQTQRREFAAVYQQRGGTVDGLIAALREKIAELDRK
ncbi:MAG TPA: ABC transporter substrate-binding protein [Alphaproteobacteria bacterium]|jgi:phospholipid transport system substrate-binding protein